MRVHLVCLSLLLAGLATQSAGCLVLAAGAGAAGTVAYLRGDLETEEPYKLEAVYAATREATKQLQLSVLEGKTEKDALSATIIARDAADKRLTIQLTARTEQTTKIAIRIGTFGDQTKSHMIYSQIRENLKATTSAAPQVAAKPSEPTVSPQAAPAINPPASPPSAPATPPPPSPQAAAPAVQTPVAATPPTVASPPAVK